MRGALEVANSRLHRLMPWALVSASVSIVLSILERYGVVGRIVASLVGLAWNLVTFLTVPIIVIEDVGVKAGAGGDRESVRGGTAATRDRDGEGEGEGRGEEARVVTHAYTIPLDLQAREF